MGNRPSAGPGPRLPLGREATPTDQARSLPLSSRAVVLEWLVDRSAVASLSDRGSRSSPRRSRGPARVTGGCMRGALRRSVRELAGVGGHVDGMLLERRQ
jgi:hypothetical protein